MRLYTLVTSSHERLFYEHFSPSLPKEFDDFCSVRMCNVQNGTGTFDEPGFFETCLEKVQLIIDACEKEKEPFIYSDVDVRFYGPVVENLKKCLGDCDIAFQWDGTVGRECTGFMIIRPDTREFWRQVKDVMQAQHLLDQPATHKVLGWWHADIIGHAEIERWYRGRLELRRALLPDRYWTYGAAKSEHWTPGTPVNPPQNILVHHANWTVGVENKLAMLEAVRKKVEHLRGSFSNYQNFSIPKSVIEAVRVKVEGTVDQIEHDQAEHYQVAFDAVAVKHAVAAMEAYQPKFKGWCTHHQAVREVYAPNRLYFTKETDFADTPQGGIVDVPDYLVAEIERPLHMIERNEGMGATASMVKLLDEQRAQLSSRHHPLLLAIVMQFWRRDKARALKLARLIADLEVSYRDDVCFVFARQANTPLDAAIWEAGLHVGQKMPVKHLETWVNESKPYPGICHDPWWSAAWQLTQQWYDGAPWSSFFFCEADGCPIGSDWIDRLKRAHEETLLLGKRVTGPLIRFGGVDVLHPPGGHINGTMVVYAPFFSDHRETLSRCPPNMPWDVFHGHVFTREAGPSQIIRNEYGGMGLSEAIYWTYAKEHCWVTSLKDGLAQHWCRKNIEERQGAK